MVVLAIVGSLLLSNEQIEVHTFVLAIILGGLFSNTLAKFPTFHHIGIIYNNAVSNIESVMHVKPIDRCKGYKNLNNGDIKFRDVSFSYEKKEKNVLEDIDLVFKKKNSMNAIVGASGSGKKTTIANLLMGFGNLIVGK